MLQETPSPPQILEAARTSLGQISLLPEIKSGNSEALMDGLDQRFDFLKLVDDFGKIPKDRLGGKRRLD